MSFVEALTWPQMAVLLFMALGAIAEPRIWGVFATGIVLLLMYAKLIS